MSDQISDAWSLGFNLKNSGIIGALFGSLIVGLFGKAGSIVTMIILLFVVFMLMTGTTMSSLIEIFSNGFSRASGFAQDRIAKRERERAEREPKPARRKKPEYIVPKSEDVFEEDEDTHEPESVRGGRKGRKVVATEVEPVEFEEPTEVPEDTTQAVSYTHLTLPTMAVV